MIYVLWPCDRSKVWISCDYQCHLARPGYHRDYAGTDLAGREQPLRGSQWHGKVLQAHYSNLGYGYTTFVEYYDAEGKAFLRVRNAHQRDLGVRVGDEVSVDTNLGIMDSTGNSTGTHTHFEVWLYLSGKWTNVDPLNPVNQILLVNQAAELPPIGEVEMPEPTFVPPQDAVLRKVKPTDYITQYINLRSSPFTTGAIIGRVYPGEEWDFIASSRDHMGNYWYAIRRGDKIGWAAGYYNGMVWLGEA